MTERDELAKEIFIVDNSRMTREQAAAGWEEVQPEYAFHIADGLRAAGYRRPRLIKTAAELDKLPLRSVVLDGVGNPWKRADDGTWWCGPYSDQTTPMLALLGPVRVISEGDEVGG